MPVENPSSEESKNPRNNYIDFVRRKLGEEEIPNDEVEEIANMGAQLELAILMRIWNPKDPDIGKIINGKAGVLRRLGQEKVIRHAAKLARERGKIPRQ